jgi:hypothetical protein
MSKAKLTTPKFTAVYSTVGLNLDANDEQLISIFARACSRIRGKGVAVQIMYTLCTHYDEFWTLPTNQRTWLDLYNKFLRADMKALAVKPVEPINFSGANNLPLARPNAEDAFTIFNMVTEVQFSSESVKASFSKDSVRAVLLDIANQRISFGFRDPASINDEKRNHALHGAGHNDGGEDFPMFIDDWGCELPCDNKFKQVESTEVIAIIDRTAHKQGSAILANGFTNDLDIFKYLVDNKYEYVDSTVETKISCRITGKITSNKTRRLIAWRKKKQNQSSSMVTY